MKRSELIEFLKEVLRVCGESIVVEIVWLNKAGSAVSGEGENFELFVKLGSGTLDRECLHRVIEKFGVKMRKEGELRIFSGNE